MYPEPYPVFFGGRGAIKDFFGDFFVAVEKRQQTLNNKNLNISNSLSGAREKGIKQN